MLEKKIMNPILSLLNCTLVTSLSHDGRAHYLSSHLLILTLNLLPLFSLSLFSPSDGVPLEKARRRLGYALRQMKMKSPYHSTSTTVPPLFKIHRETKLKTLIGTLVVESS